MKGRIQPPMICWIMVLDVWLIIVKGPSNRLRDDIGVVYAPTAGLREVCTCAVRRAVLFLAGVLTIWPFQGVLLLNTTLLWGILGRPLFWKLPVAVSHEYR